MTIGINKTTVLVIGGCNDNGDTTKKTYKKKYNFDSGQWSNGSELLIERYGHACGVVENSTNLMIVVIGGRNNHQNEYFDSVEFAVLWLWNRGWSKTRR